MPDMKVRFLASLGGDGKFEAELLVDKVLTLDDDNKVIGTQKMQLADVVLEFSPGEQFPVPGKSRDDVVANVSVPGVVSLPIDPKKLVLREQGDELRSRRVD